MVTNNFWQTQRPAIQVGRKQGVVVLPAFVAGTIPPGVNDNLSNITTQFNYNISNNFTFQIPRGTFNEIDHTFILCVKQVLFEQLGGDEPGNGYSVERYKLWSPKKLAAFDTCIAPNYSGQLIRHNFILEIFTFGANEDIAEFYNNPAPLNLPTSIVSPVSSLTDAPVYSLPLGVACNSLTLDFNVTFGTNWAPCMIGTPNDITNNT